MKRKGQGSKGHRRSYLPDGRVNHYEMLKLQQHAVKFARIDPAASLAVANAVGKELRRLAMHARSGTQTHVNLMAGVKRYAGAAGLIRGAWFRMTVAVGRAYTWVRGRDRSYRPSPRNTEAYAA